MTDSHLFFYLVKIKFYTFLVVLFGWVLRLMFVVQAKDALPNLSVLDYHLLALPCLFSDHAFWGDVGEKS